METLCEKDKSWAPERLAQEGIIQTAMGRKGTHAGTANIFEGQMDRFHLVAGHWVVTKGTCESKRSAISPRPKFEEGPLAIVLAALLFQFVAKMPQKLAEIFTHAHLIDFKDSNSWAGHGWRACHVT